MSCILLLAFLSALRLVSGSEVRLVGGKHAYEGRVEVKYDSEWKAICDHGWNMKAANVVCRMLGYPEALRYTTGHTAYGRGDGHFWLDDVNCGGREYDIERCSHRDWGRHNCRSTNQAGVICKLHRSDVIFAPEPSPASGEVINVNVKLIGPIVDDYISEGIVQVEQEGKWGYICPSKWTRANSYVLCGQLGFPNAEELESYTETIQDSEPVYWLDQVTCKGWESSIVSCDHAGWVRHRCEGGQALKIKCTRKNITQTPEVRLRSGALVGEGRVELYRSQGRVEHWGTVCDDHWTLREANVVCRSLGYGSAAIAAKNAYFGRGIGEVILHNLQCLGVERNIRHCKHQGWRRSMCNHYEDAGVKCHVPQLQGHTIRLSGGLNSYEGRVEVFHGGSWGTVCADNWRIEEAMVACRQLNLGYASHAITQNYFGPTNLRVAMSGVICLVDEISIYNCQHDPWENATCSNRNKLAGVICVDELPDLVLDTDALKEEMRLDFQPLHALQCAFEENCLAKSADVLFRPENSRYNRFNRRSLLRFTAKIENRGWDHFRSNTPMSGWEYHQCHAHYHSMETFASYELLRQGNYVRRAQGHKASFCLEDTECDPGFEKRWNCTRGGDQGLSPGCFDIYSSKIDCQWVDCTGIRQGSFYLRVQLNPGNQVAESDFKNNVAKCTVYHYGSFVIANKCWIETCESGVDTYGGNSAGKCCTKNGDFVLTRKVKRPEWTALHWKSSILNKASPCSTQILRTKSKPIKKTNLTSYFKIYEH
ncbi:hypothetical protein ACROYT_G005651 [Oculina patagonica]